MSNTPLNFAEITELHPRLVEALERRGMKTAFPVQAKVIPTAITGRDMLVQSPTGSGKTLAFGLPIIERLKRDTRKPAALIMVPTRELAVQVCDDLHPLATGKQLRCVAVYGGAPIVKQAQAAKTAAIIVATPGRLHDLIRNRKIDVRNVEITVLDEADRMLDMGFQPQVDAIMAELPRVSAQTPRQMLLFSATLEGKVAQIAETYTTDPEVVRNEVAVNDSGKIKHVVWETNSRNKVDTALEVLERERDLAVIFVRTKRGCDTLCKRLRTYGIRATAIHGGMTQRERLREYRRFQDGVCDVLVATDVFARGMDLDRITLVLNYDLPEDADTYRHRVGRTGRAGRTGTAITMMLPSQRKQLRRMLHEASVNLDVMKRVERTQKTGREPLPEKEHFTPPAFPERKQSSKKPRRGSQNQRSGQRHGDRFTRRPFNKKKAGPAMPGDGAIIKFDHSKGFGFIKPDHGGEDVFFHKDALLNSKSDSIRKGARVSFATQQHRRGERALKVRQLAADRS